MKKKVAIVLPFFTMGGAENMVSLLASNINLDRFEVRVFCVNGTDRDTTLEKRIRVKGIPIEYCEKKIGRFSIRAVCTMYAKLKTYNPDIIHTHLSACIYCVPFCLLHKQKMLHTIHNEPLKEISCVHRQVMRFMYAIGKAAPIAISDTICEMTKKIYKNCSHVIYNPVEIPSSDNNKSVFYRKDSTIRFISVSRTVPQKNHKLMIQAFSEVEKIYPHIALTILGDGESRRELQNMVKDLQLQDKVFLPGFVENVRDHLSKSDVFLLSSKYEGLPLAVLEAMSCGLPVIATNVGGMGDIVKDNGILVPISLKAFADAMKELIVDDEKRKLMSTNSKVESSKYDISIIAEQYEKLYEEYSV